MAARGSICIFPFPMRSDRLDRLCLTAGLSRGPAVGLLVAVVLLGTLVGCARPPSDTASSILKKQPTVEPRDPALALLDYAHRLATISPAARVTAVKTARADVHDRTSAAAYARLAIALGTPGQKLYTPDEAARYARLALEAEPSPWNTRAHQYLGDYARLYTRLTDDSDQHSADTNSQSTAAQVRRLQTELDEAHKKLRALAHIEERLDSKDEGS